MMIISSLILISIAVPVLSTVLRHSNAARVLSVFECSAGSCTGFGTPTRPMETNLPSFGVLLFVLRVESVESVAAGQCALVRLLCSSFDFGAKHPLREFHALRVLHLSNRR